MLFSTMAVIIYTPTKDMPVASQNSFYPTKAWISHCFVDPYFICSLPPSLLI